jgi:hypothetical protein
LLKQIIIGVTCADNGFAYNQTVTVMTDRPVLEQVMRAIPCCGACGSEDIVLAVRVKQLKGAED